MGGLIYSEAMVYCGGCGAPAVVRVVNGVKRYFHDGPCRPRGWRKRTRQARASRLRNAKRRRRYV